MDSPNSDFHLKETSIAVDNGTDAGAPSDDYDGNPRPVGQGYDIGAYEYQGSVDVFDFEGNSGMPGGYSLSQNYPNPFNPATLIEYEIPRGKPLQNVTINIYNLSGEKVRTLLNRSHLSGEFAVQWDGRDDTGTELPGGVYLYRLQSEAGVETRKMLLIR
jgi:hypothetical protein